MKKNLLGVLSLIAFLAAGSANAVENSQMDAVQSLGKLNGIALYCGHLDQTQNMKKAMVDNLPKLRVLGAAFDQASNDSYLNYSNEGKLCPLKSAFGDDVTQAINHLTDQFSRK